MSTTCPDRQRGFAVVAALFILVVLASLSAYMLTISSSHHIGNALDIESSRALQAARAGMDWGIERAVNAPTAFGAGDCRTGPFPTTATVNLTTGAGGDFPLLAGYVITVSCTGRDYTDGAALISYDLTATACNQPAGGVCPNTAPVGTNYVERRLNVQVTCNAALPC